MCAFVTLNKKITYLLTYLNVGLNKEADDGYSGVPIFPYSLNSTEAVFLVASS